MTTTAWAIAPDEFEPDDVPIDAKMLPLDGNTSQLRNFDRAEDDDWVRLSLPFRFAFQEVRAVQIGTNVDIRVSVYRVVNDSPELLLKVDENGKGAGLSEVFTPDDLPPQPGGLYFLHITPGGGCTGDGSSYRLQAVPALAADQIWVTSSDLFGGNMGEVADTAGLYGEYCLPIGDPCEDPDTASVADCRSNRMSRFGEVARAEFFDVSPGVYQASATTPPGYEPWALKSLDEIHDPCHSNGNPRLLRTTEFTGTTTQITFQFAPVIYALGQVVDASSGQPVAGVQAGFVPINKLYLFEGTPPMYDRWPPAAPDGAWETDESGWLPLAILLNFDYDLHLRHCAYEDVVIPGAIAGAARGDLVDLGVIQMQPLPLSLSITANGQDGEIEVEPDQPFTVEVELCAGQEAGQPADWWVVARVEANGDLYHLHPDFGWRRGLGVWAQSPLAYRRETVYQDGLLTPGRYSFFFGIDRALNGRLDRDRLVVDRVQVVVAAP
jgi:hypothetical protein